MVYAAAIRHLSKPAYREEFKGDTEVLATAAYTLVREDASLGSTYKLPLEAKFRKMSYMMQSSVLMVGDDDRHVQSLKFTLSLKSIVNCYCGFSNSPTTMKYFVVVKT
ncbi:hypothetical protein H6P87_01140 [Rickettsia tillamookensis]|uniref:Uncharacterized protein n=1 Tax=Rickettsia tillamookensis TaxID=2761623 RepID=A0A9E6MIY2_9RICK|nr:palindromic element RPE1 domain-containing protein [Rickettsia tillamookensis]QQV75578.1 hypothetical protein H6P87_01140 [Rickettsia tillamookensis]